MVDAVAAEATLSDNATIIAAAKAEQAEADAAAELAARMYGIAINPTITGGTTATLTFDNGVDEAASLEVTTGVTAIIALKAGTYTIASVGAELDVTSIVVTTHAVQALAITVSGG
jgi:hypothetical protein